MRIHTWFGCHRLLCSLFNSDSDRLSVQLFLTRRRAVFADDAELHRTLSMLPCGRFDVTEITLLQGLHT